LGVHLAQGGTGHQKSTVQMHVHHLAPVGKGQFMHRINVLDAGVSQGHIEPAPSVNDVGNPLVHRLLIGDIHGQGHGCAARLLDGRDGAGGSFQRQVGDRHPGAFAGVMFGNGPANAPASAGDECNLVVKTHHTVSLLMIGLLLVLFGAVTSATAIDFVG
jgi:hypothetical protein